MSRSESLFPIAATLLSGFFLAACVFLLPGMAEAGEQPSSPPIAGEEDVADVPAGDDKTTSPCTCPESSPKSGKPKFAELQSDLDDADEAAALESVQLALSKVGDGAAYIWHRSNGRLSGLVQPTSSFRNGKGSICRHLILMLTTGDKTRKTEGIACRADNGLWQLEG
jgi:hypothetical protein